MGIKGLWTVSSSDCIILTSPECLKHVQSAARATSLIELGLTHLKQHNTLYCMGVDIALWFHTSPAGLETFFFRCCHLRSLPIQVVFVFDGKARPIVKRGHKVMHRDYPTRPAIRRLLDAFGFDYIEVKIPLITDTV